MLVGDSIAQTSVSDFGFVFLVCFSFLDTFLDFEFEDAPSPTSLP